MKLFIILCALFYGSFAFPSSPDMKELVKKGGDIPPIKGHCCQFSGCTQCSATALCLEVGDCLFGVSTCLLNTLLIPTLTNITDYVLLFRIRKLSESQCIRLR